MNVCDHRELDWSSCEAPILRHQSECTGEGGILTHADVYLAVPIVVSRGAYASSSHELTPFVSDCASETLGL